MRFTQPRNHSRKHFLAYFRLQITTLTTSDLTSGSSLLPGRQIPLGLEAPRALQNAEPDRGADQDVVSEPADQVEEADGRQTEAGAATGTPPARPVLRGRRHGILAPAATTAATLDTGMIKKEG